VFADDPDTMSTDDRLNELAALLAAGFLRLRRRTGYLPQGTPLGADQAESPQDSPADSAADSPCHLSQSSALCHTG